MDNLILGAKLMNDTIQPGTMGYFTSGSQDVDESHFTDVNARSSRWPFSKFSAYANKDTRTEFDLSVVGTLQNVFAVGFDLSLAKAYTYPTNILTCPLPAPTTDDMKRHYVYIVLYHSDRNASPVPIRFFIEATSCTTDGIKATYNFLPRLTVGQAAPYILDFSFDPVIICKVVLPRLECPDDHQVSLYYRHKEKPTERGLTCEG